MSGFSQQVSMSGDMVRLDRHDPYLRLLCINIFVRDQERSLQFYRDQLGFSVVVDYSYESAGRALAVAPPDGHTVLALVTPKRNSEDAKLIGRCRHGVFVTEDVVAKFEEWQKRGVHFHHPPQTTLWGGIFTRFDDLDGNSFALVSRNDFVREFYAQRRAPPELHSSPTRHPPPRPVTEKPRARCRTRPRSAAPSG